MIDGMKMPSVKPSSVFESRGFNPGRDALVDDIKFAASLLFSKIDDIEDGPESSRLKALARTELESCVMWAVKAISRETPLSQPCNSEEVYTQEKSATDIDG